jgi:hypothetical protein
LFSVPDLQSLDREILDFQFAPKTSPGEEFSEELDPNKVVENLIENITNGKRGPRKTLLKLKKTVIGHNGNA